MDINRYTLISAILLVVATIFVGVKTFYKLALDRDAGMPTVQATRKKVDSIKNIVSRPFSHYRSIIDRNLFNTKIEGIQTAAAIDVKSLRKTDLKLKLWGTVVTDAENSSYAVIEDTKKRKQNLYRIGDAIETASVKLILREKVVLSVGGRDEILLMEKKRGSYSSSARPASSAVSQRRVRASRPQRITLRRTQVEDALKDVNNLLTQVKIQPFIENGKSEGLIIRNIKPNSIFRRMGLRNGDIIMGANGEKIESVDNALKFYEELKTSESVNLNLKRRGRQKTITYNVK